MLGMTRSPKSIRPANRTMTTRDANALLDEKIRRRKRNSALTLLASIAGGMAASKAYTEFGKKGGAIDKEAGKLALLGRLDKEILLRLLTAAGVYAGTSVWETARAEGREFLPENRFGIPAHGGLSKDAPTYHKAVSGAMSSGGTKLMGALAAFLAGPKYMFRKPAVGVAISAIPSIVSGQSHRIWPGEGMAGGIREMPKVTKALGNVALNYDRLPENVVEAAKHEIKDTVKRELSPVVDALKETGRGLAVAGGGATAGYLLASALLKPSRKRETEGEDWGRTITPAEMDALIRRRDRRDRKERSVKGLSAALGGLVGAGAYGAYRKARGTDA
jgi:hypothetical protein